MILNISDLLNEKIEKENLNLEITEEKLNNELGNILILKPIRLEGKLKALDNMVTLDGEISTRVRLNCSRCLEQFDADLNFKIYEQFSNKQDICAQDENVTFVEDDKINIMNIISNNIILNLPMKTLCKEDCKGLCQNCGINLNYNQCNCKKEAIDPRMEKLKDFFSRD